MYSLFVVVVLVIIIIIIIIIIAESFLHYRVRFYHHHSSSSSFCFSKLCRLILYRASSCYGVHGWLCKARRFNNSYVCLRVDTDGGKPLQHGQYDWHCLLQRARQNQGVWQVSAGGVQLQRRGRGKIQHKQTVFINVDETKYLLPRWSTVHAEIKTHLLRAQNCHSLISSSCPGVGQKVALYAFSTARKYVVLISSFTVHSPLLRNQRYGSFSPLRSLE